MKYLHKLQAGEKRVQSLLTLHANLAASYLPVPVQRYWAIPEKKQTGGLRTYFLKNPVFHFFTLPLEIPDKKLHPWTLEIPQSFVRSLGNSPKPPKNQDPWKFLFFSYSPLEIPLHF